MRNNVMTTGTRKNDGRIEVVVGCLLFNLEKGQTGYDELSKAIDESHTMQEGKTVIPTTVVNNLFRQNKMRISGRVVAGA